MNTVDKTQPVNAAYEAENPSQDRLVIKNGSHFLILDERGMMPISQDVPAPFGLFRDDTRYLSAWQIYINRTHPRLLSRDITGGFQAEFVYGNQKVDGIPEQSVLIARSLVIADRFCEKLVVTNFHTRAVDVEIAIVFDTDFADMFEVRGAKRPARGTLNRRRVRSLGGAQSGKRIACSYRGIDGSVMRSAIDIRAGQAPITIEPTAALVKLHLEPGQAHTIETAVVTNIEAQLDGVPFTNPTSTRRSTTFDKARERAVSDYAAWRESGCTITTGNTTLNDVLDRAYRDLYILRQPTPQGMCMGAGTPWFAAAFGRDQAVTALQLLNVLPNVAREVISVLAAYQGKLYDTYTEERPGKIMHELRLGEMARTGEIPFKPYYGTVDATPLWLLLVARYVAKTRDFDFANRIWPNVEAALNFLAKSVHATGYLTYGGIPGAALSNQGWKDSGDSIMYSNGKLARAPIALCEPQGYLHEAWARLSVLASDMGKQERAEDLARRAMALKRRFTRDFWMPEHKFVALALDGNGDHCDVVSSNPGHLLATGILDDEKANLVANKLMSKSMFCGWGVRTLAEGEAAFNPMSYHNGSVWPHDNAMTAEGLCLIGRTRDAHRILSGLLAAAAHQADLRLPELFCGFANPQSQGPIRYPVSCVPQAWAAGTMFQILTACLGLETEANRLDVIEPSIPAWVGHVVVNNLVVGDRRVDLRFDTTGDGRTEVTVLQNSGNVTIHIE